MMMQNAELEILAILRRNDANFAGKLLSRAVNLEKTIHKKAANPHADQSKGLTASETTASGCYNKYTTEVGRLSIGKREDTAGEIRYCPMWSGVPYTTAAARNQEGRNGHESN